MVIYYIWLHMPMNLARDRKEQADLFSTSHQDCIMNDCVKKKSKKQNNNHNNKNPANQPSKHTNQTYITSKVVSCKGFKVGSIYTNFKTHKSS